MINRKNCLIVRAGHGLSEEQSYPKLLLLIQDLEKERGHLLTDKQVNALQAFAQAMIDSRARITCYEDE
jgi:hypothetical protein